MADKYFSQTTIQDLIQTRDRIFAEYNTVWKNYQIDILANDTLSSLSIWEIVRQYDADYNINFHRNGEDAKSKDKLIEQKCANVTPGKRGGVGLAGFTFHAQGKLNYDRYVFAVRRKNNLQLARLWDVSTEDGVKLVQIELDAGKQDWIRRGKPNHDGIQVKEKNLRTLEICEHLIINGCQVYRV